jgi:hypothetical protein
MDWTWREHYADPGLAFEDSPPFGVGANCLLAPPLPFTSGVRLFEFVDYDVLQPDFHAHMTR